MTFDEWWETKNMDKAQVPMILKNAIRDLAFEAWNTAQQQILNNTDNYK